MQPHDVIYHYGVRGMRWGHRKSLTPVEEVRKLTKRIERINTNRAIEGTGYAGHHAKKQYEKAIQKDPKFSYLKLNSAEKKKYMDRAYNKARAEIALRGVAEAVALGAAMGLTGKYLMGFNNKNAMEAAASGTLYITAFRASQLHSTNSAQKFNQAHERLRELEREKDPAVTKALADWRNSF